MSDEELLELVQKQTFQYFWEFAHPICGMARERDSENFLDVISTGGTGFGIMAIIVAAERKWITRTQAAERILTITKFLQQCETYHGAFAHWVDGGTGKTIPFSKKDDGADLVETSFLFQGLLTARQYFTRNNSIENNIRHIINTLWQNVEWDWFTRGRDVLYWHWSPNFKWYKNLKIEGYNEALITYILAAASPAHSISAAAYHKGWARNGHQKNGKKFYNVALPLGPDYGGPLFFSQYSFLGLDPRGLKDEYTDYWKQNMHHSKINYLHCVHNPGQYKGYAKDCWGLSACDSGRHYHPHSPVKDNGTLCPSASISALPYLPKESLAAIKNFYHNFYNQLWGSYGFADGFNISRNWYSHSYLAINQGPIIVMIENHRTGLLWNLFMSCPEVLEGLKKLGFKSPHLK